MSDSFIDLDISKMPDLSWRTARIPKKSGGMRTLHIPNDELKSAQRKVLEYLYQFDTLRPMMSVVGFVPGRDTMSGVIQHDTRAMFVICMDIKDFFDNCNVAHAAEELIKAGVPASKVDYIMEVCTYNGSFAQGAPSSPYLANIAMVRFDRFMSRFTERRGLTYTRYADDIAIAENMISKNNDSIYYYPYYAMIGQHVRREQGRIYRVIRGVEKLLSVCSASKLRINCKKTRVAWRNGGKASRRITGVVMRNDALGYNAPRKMRKIARAICHNLYCAIRYNNESCKDNIHEWRKLKGYVTYCDRVRHHSSCVECASDDPFVNSEKYEYLKSRFEAHKNNKQKGESNVNSSC